MTSTPKTKNEKRRSQLRFGIVVMSAMTLFSIAFGYHVLWPVPLSYRRVVATVTSVGSSGSCKSSVPRIGVVYTVNGQVREAEGQSAFCPSEVKINDTMTVAIDPKDSSRFYDIRVWPGIIVPVVGVLLGAGAVVYYLKDYRKMTKS